MAKPEEVTERLVYEVLTGELQQRYIECGRTQLHPNYAPNPNIPPIGSLYGRAKDTKRAIQAAFLIRWVGLSNRDPASIDETAEVPQLFDTNGEALQYEALDSIKSFKLLGRLGMVELRDDLVAPTSKIRKTIVRHPGQEPTVMPRSGIFGVKETLRDGIRVHKLYNKLLLGEGVEVPLGMTTSTPSIDRKRRNLRVVKDE